MHGRASDILTSAQRSWNARATTLAGAVLGWVSLPVVAYLPVPQGKAEILSVLFVTDVVLTVAHVLTRFGLISPGVLLLVVASLAQHLALITQAAARSAIPYFAAVPVLIGAACLPRRFIPLAVGLGVAALGIEWTIADAAGAPAGELQRTFVPACVLLALTATVTWIAVLSLERGYELAQEQENQQKRLMSELEERTRLASLGQLTAGIAHDFNNFLVVVQASVDLAEHSLEPDHPARIEIDQIRSAASRASGLSEELLAFSRKRRAPVTRLRAGAVVEDVAPLLKRLVSPARELRVEVSDPDLVVLASSLQIEQVLFNLVSNARDASPPGSEITVRCQTREVATDARGTIPPGRYVELAVEDHGTGVSDDVRNRLFEPFVTTKPAGRGTGLGLSTCQSIAAELGGAITVETTPGQGSTFAFVLPVLRETALVPPSSYRDGAVRRALVVDDDAEVRALVVRLLESSGVTVLQADGARNALEVVRSAAQLDLIITDVVLGGASVATLSEFRRVQPTARLVVMSSLKPDPATLTELDRCGATFLQKPFLAVEVQALARAGDESPARAG